MWPKASITFLLLLPSLDEVASLGVPPFHPPKLALVGRISSSSSTSEESIFSKEEHRLGLLRGVNPQTDSYFSSAIDVTNEGLAWLSKPGMFWEAALTDAAEMKMTAEEYIENVCWNFEEFVRSGVVHDREVLLKEVNELLTRSGVLMLVLGGRSVGKSLVLRNFRDRCNSGDAVDEKRLVLLVNGRLHINQLATGLVEEALKVFNRELSKVQFGRLDQNAYDLLNQFFKVSMETASDALKSNAVFDLMAKWLLKDETASADQVPYFLKIADLLKVVKLNATSKDAPAPIAIESFAEFAEGRGLYPIVIIDEANAVLGSNMTGTKEVLYQIVQYTKETHRLNVILSTSEHGYPYQLEREGLNLDQVTKIVVAGDMSPRRTWELYVNDAGSSFGHAAGQTKISKKLFKTCSTAGPPTGATTIGMGRHLAELCLAAYGGHVLITQNALWALASGKERFTARKNLPRITVKIKNCLKVHGTRPLLEAIAVHGYVLIDNYQDVAVETIVKHDVGGILDRFASSAEHVPESIWFGREEEFCLIPSFMAMRLVIANVLSVESAGIPLGKD